MVKKMFGWIMGAVVAFISIVAFCANYVSGQADKRLEQIMKNKK